MRCPFFDVQYRCNETEGGSSHEDLVGGSASCDLTGKVLKMTIKIRKEADLS